MDALDKLPKWVIVALAFPLICLNGWVLYQLGERLQPITDIAITASLIAFLLDYPIILLEKRRVPRGVAIALVLLITVLLASLLIIFLGPLVWQQLNDFATRLPRWVEEAKTQLLLLNDRAFLQNAPIDLASLTVQAADQLSNTLQTGVSQVINVTLSTANLAVNVLITVVLSILLLLNGEQLWSGMLSWFSEEWQIKIRDALGPSFRDYFSGQASLAIILAAAQSAAFVLIDVPFGLLFGVVIGLFSIIPFGGIVAILSVSVLLTFQSVGLGLKVLAIAVVLGQINDNVVAPRLLGDKTGLNPAIIVLSLLTGAKLAGFLGLLLAVPIASFVKKIVDVSRA